MARKLYRVGHKPSSPRVLWGIEAALNAMIAENYVPFEEDEMGSIMVPASGAVVPRLEKQEEYTEKVLGYESLSNEARYVVGLALAAPGEVFSMIATPTTKHITKSRLGLYLRKLGWPSKRVRKTFDELASYTECFGYDN